MGQNDIKNVSYRYESITNFHSKRRIIRAYLNGVQIQGYRRASHVIGIRTPIEEAGINEENVGEDEDDVNNKSELVEAGQQHPNTSRKTERE